MLNVQQLVEDPQHFSNVRHEDVDTIADHIIELLEKKITFNSIKVANQISSGNIDVPKAAFKRQAEDAIVEAIHTYLIHEKWKSNTPILPYLITAINRLASSAIDNGKGKVSRLVVNICPACKEMKDIEQLLTDEDMFVCNKCEKSKNMLKQSIVGIYEPEDEIKAIKDKISLLSAFCKHSSTGVKCPKCKKFVPNSWKVGEILTCPYPGCKEDCSNAESMKHPISLFKRSHVSMNTSYKSATETSNIGDRYCTGTDNAFALLSKEQEYLNKFEIISKVIGSQKQINGITRKLPNKLAMYEAFEAILLEFPQEMMDYLTIGGQGSGVAVQALIYQKFAEIMQSKLPISVFAKGMHVYIDTPTDERLFLYKDMRQFTNFIDQNLCIKRRDQYIIENDKLIENTEKNFIGKLISVTATNGLNLLPYIDNYNFSAIHLENDSIVKPGTDVVVKYYSIFPSYTMGSMIHLQRIKRKLSDSINKKLEM